MLFCSTEGVHYALLHSGLNSSCCSVVECSLVLYAKKEKKNTYLEISSCE